MFIPKVIHGGSVAANALLYNEPDNRLKEYISNNIAMAMDATRSIGTGFINTVESMYNKFNNSEIVNAAKMILYNAGTHLSQDSIHYVRYENVHNANLIMQKYILANPTIYNLYQNNMCHGYADTYIDSYSKNTPVEERIEYQQVMDGLLQFDKNDEGYVNHYSHEEDDLCLMDKISISDTWDAALRRIAEGIDPTDPDLNDL